MIQTSALIRKLRPLLADHPGLKDVLRRADIGLARAKHSLAEHLPALIRPAPRQLTIAVTAQCNLRCIGCRYGRDFMVGESLSLEVLRDVLTDARDAGVNRVRLYGGEPMLHKDLPEILRFSTSLGLDTYLTSNATLLRERIDDLFEAGLRWMTIGFYGVGEKYADYTQRKGHYEKLCRGLDYVRERYGQQLEIQLNYVLVGPTTNLDALHEAWEFANRYGLFFHLDMYGYSMPFFTQGEHGEVGFQPSDHERIAEVCRELVALKLAHPERFPQSLELIRSVKDWLILGPEMKVPCDAYDLLWLGADGTLKLCDVTFELGNVNRTRLRDLLFTPQHASACRDAFALRCPNCTCKSDSRIRKHAASMARYGTDSTQP